MCIRDRNIEGNEELVKRMHDEGHLIGNHSFSHVQLTKAGAKTVCQAVDRTSRMIEDITGERPQYMRPPFGDWNEELECDVGMTTVLWSVDSLDWKLKNKNKIVKRVLKDVEDGDVYKRQQQKNSNLRLSWAYQRAQESI